MWFFYALISAVVSGSQSIFKKIVLKKEHTIEFLSIFYVFSFLLLLPFIKNFKMLDLSLISFILLRSILVIIAIISFTKALKHLSISTAAPLTNFRPLFTLILGLIILGETISFIQVMGVFVILFGSYILDSDGQLKNYKKPLKDLLKSKYIHFLLLYALFISLGEIAAKIILFKVDSYNLMFYHYLFSMLIYLSITFFGYEGIKDIKEGLKLGGFWTLIIAVLGLVATYYGFMAFTQIGAKVIIIVPVFQLSTLISSVFGGKLFHEKHIFSKVIGSIFMLFGVFIIALF